MSELGARLRQARESQGLSLAQASVDTRILQQSLIALEEGAYQRLHGDVVIRGFIRNYAQYLGLSGDELIELYRRERGVTDKIQVRPVTTPPQRRTYVLPSFFGVFFVTLALVGLTYVSLSAIGRIGTGGIASVATSEATAFVPPPSPLPSPSPTPQRTVTATNKTATPASTMLAVVASTTPRPAGGVIPVVATPTTAAPIVIEVSIADQRADTSSWVRVQADGKTVFEGVMSAGQRRSFEAQRRIVVRAGNPPAVLVTVNGMEQGALGQVSGQPVNWEWPPN
ncbi:helix-turn-helix domain-containing protein [Oscillochloris trichoides DG-6]|uniref:Helix-turn-helix domain-containing protein n=1 Tax=Oscillochloris trichoides DG-6 TaxID=765420 RepID=E1IGM2_9CHLR|nr:RodZ domain-containing protein [Oscillochloris trichoides]EFO79691.1 helix-turn-helix domain-containing protein [Oscillochloris trichoides DG-6]